MRSWKDVQIAGFLPLFSCIAIASIIVATVAMERRPTPLDPLLRLGIPAGVPLGEVRHHPRLTGIDSHYFRLQYSKELVDSLVRHNQLFPGAADPEILEYDSLNYFRFYRSESFWFAPDTARTTPAQQVFGKYYGATHDCMHFYIVSRPPFVYVSIRLGLSDYLRRELGPPSQSCIASMARWRNPENIPVDLQQLCSIVPENQLCDQANRP